MDDPVGFVCGLKDARKRAGYIDLVDDRLHDLISLVGSMSPPEPELVETIYDIYLQLRDIETDGQWSYQAAPMIHASSEAKNLFKEFMKIQDDLSAVLFNGPGQREIVEYRKLVSGLKQRKHDTWQRLRPLAPWLEDEIGGRGIPGRTVAGSLARRDIFIDVVKTKPKDRPTSPAGSGRNRKGEYWFFVVKPSIRPFVDLRPIGPQEEIDAIIDDWFKATQSPGITSAETFRQRADRLRDALYGPLERDTAEAARVWIRPAGAVSLVHFETLPGGKNHYVIDEHTFIYVNAIGRRKTLNSRAKARPVVLLGNHEAQPAGGNGFKGRFQGSGAEIELVGKRISNKKPVIYQGGPSIKKTLFNLKIAPEILHLGPPWVLKGTVVQRAGGRFYRNGPNKTLVEFTVSSQDEPENRFGPGSLELINLRPTMLLIAPNGRIESDTPGGAAAMTSMVRALIHAGTENLVVNTWKMPQKEKLDFLAAFYTILGENEHGIPDILRQAALKTAKTARVNHGSDLPFFWGGFRCWANFEVFE